MAYKFVLELYLVSINSIINFIKIKQKIPDQIYKRLIYIVLAHWITKDGAKFDKNIVLCTDKFFLQEVIILINVLIYKYDINSTVQSFS